MKHRLKNQLNNQDLIISGTAMKKLVVKVVKNEKNIYTIYKKIKNIKFFFLLINCLLYIHKPGT